jgi:large subunit ribosomal protein L9
MEVILKEDVQKLGQRGDVIKVAEGYGRNFLIPKKLAVEATKANKAVIDQMKAASVRRVAKDKADAEALAKQLEGVTLTFHRRAGEKDHLFGSVTSGDVADALQAKGFTIDRRKIQLDEPLKQLGEFNIPIRLFRDVTARVNVVVAKDEKAEA